MIANFWSGRGEKRNDFRRLSVLRIKRARLMVGRHTLPSYKHTPNFAQNKG